MPQAIVEQYWTVDQVCERLHASRTTVYAWFAGGRLKPVKAGGKTLITETALQRFIEVCTDEAEAKSSAPHTATGN